MQAATAAGRTQVKITQTAPQAVLSWSSFNVGAATDLVFDQSAGGASASTWVALNEVRDPSAQPSRILGSISAPGQVYIINRNGIIFGAGSQVNAAALLAATADFAGGSAGFLANGIYSTNGTAGLLPAFGGSGATDAPAGSLVMVQPGAQIATSAPASVENGGGFVMLFGAGVQNAGAITTPQGQTVLAAGQQFYLTPGYSSSGGGDPLATTLGSEVAVTGGGAANNTGLIEATRGDITLVGHAVTQAGVALSTTTTAQRGTIHLLTDTSDSTGSVTLAAGSLTQVAPELDDTDTALNSQRAQLIATSAANNSARLTTAPALNDIAGLADRLDQSRIEITAGGTVSFGAGSLTSAQGGQIAVSAGSGRIFAAGGAQLDVSGVVAPAQPATANVLTVNIQPTELRDSPANRDAGKLPGSNVYVDASRLTTVAASLADPGTRIYTPGGLLEVSGYVAEVGHTIAEWATIGGTVTLAAGSVVVQPGAGINLAGGSESYQAGMIPASWLIGSDGQLYTVNNAPASLTYTGVYGGFTVDHAKWGVSATYASALVAPSQVWRDGYTVGRDAGSLILSTPAAVIEGTISAGTVTGAQQTAARPAGVSDPFTLAQTVAPLGGTLALGQYAATGLTGTYPTDVVLGSAAPAVAAGIGAADPLPAGRGNTAWFAAGLLDGAGFASVQIASGGAITLASPLSFAPGGQIALIAPEVTIEAGLVAPSAGLTLGNRLPGTGAFLPGAAAVTLAGGATIDLRGQWNNRLRDPLDASGAAFVNGGSASLDSSGGVTLAAGSAIDVSAGGTLSASGAFSGGKGGSVTLTADDPAAGAGTAPLVLQGTLSGFGASGGGALSITAPAVRIAAAAPADAPVGTLVLTPALFARGFGSYAITGLNGVAVAPGTALAVTVPTEVPSAAAAALPTGSDPALATDIGLLPLFTPNATRATLTQRPGASLTLQAVDNTAGGALAIGAGAAITVDPGQSVSLQAHDFDHHRRHDHRARRQHRHRQHALSGRHRHPAAVAVRPGAGGVAGRGQPARRFRHRQHRARQHGPALWRGAGRRQHQHRRHRRHRRRRHAAHHGCPGDHPPGRGARCQRRRGHDRSHRRHGAAGRAGARCRRRRQHQPVVLHRHLRRRHAARRRRRGGRGRRHAGADDGNAGVQHQPVRRACRPDGAARADRHAAAGDATAGHAAGRRGHAAGRFRPRRHRRRPGDFRRLRRARPVRARADPVRRRCHAGGETVGHARQCGAGGGHGVRPGADRGAVCRARRQHRAGAGAGRCGAADQPALDAAGHHQRRHAGDQRRPHRCRQCHPPRHRLGHSRPRRDGGEHHLSGLRPAHPGQQRRPAVPQRHHAVQQRRHHAAGGTGLSGGRRHGDRRRRL